VSEVEEAVDGGLEFRPSGSTILIVEAFSGRAGNLVESLSSSLNGRLVRVGVVGLDMVCEKRECKDPDIEVLKLARVSSSEWRDAPVEILLVGNNGANRPS